MTTAGTANTTYGTASDLYFPHHQTDMYSRPYDSWQFQQHVKQETAGVGVNGSGSWWDMHQAAAANGWLADAMTAPSAHMHAAAAAAAAYSAGDYSASLAAAGSTAHLLAASTGQHLLQDTYKSMQQHHSAATPFGVAGLGGPTGHQAASAATVAAAAAASSAHQVVIHPKDSLLIHKKIRILINRVAFVA